MFFCFRCYLFFLLESCDYWNGLVSQVIWYYSRLLSPLVLKFNPIFIFVILRVFYSRSPCEILLLIERLSAYVVILLNLQKLGLTHLGEGVKKAGIRSPLCAITMLGYRIVVGPILGRYPVHGCMYNSVLGYL